MTESDIEESQDLEEEETFRKLRSKIPQEVVLCHPICYSSYIILELAADLKLTKFVIEMLQGICGRFDILITDIKVKRKHLTSRGWLALAENALVREKFKLLIYMYIYLIYQCRSERPAYMLFKQ